MSLFIFIHMLISVFVFSGCMYFVGYKYFDSDDTATCIFLSFLFPPFSILFTLDKMLNYDNFSLSEKILQIFKKLRGAEKE